MIITRTPFRITLGGGGTDIPSYYQHNGGLVATMAIDKHVYITVKPDSFEKLCKLRYSEIEIVDDLNQLKNARAREALLAHGLSEVEINTCADLSCRSGLGSSGSFLVGLLKAIREYKHLDSSPGTIADEACTIEIDKLGEPVGKQDQYIAAFGGIRVLEISKDGVVNVDTLKIDYQQLIQNMHVYSLNVQRDASEVLSEQQKMSGDTKRTMDTIKEFGKRSIEFLVSGDFDEYGRLLDAYWQEKKKLSTRISLPMVDEFYEMVKSSFGVLGGKIIGAGGGGFLLLYTNQRHAELETCLASIGLQRLHYTVDHTGSVVLGNFL
jgi:D-glycero-alpha-D-manno-heptose-7-phosphate kinase